MARKYGKKNVVKIDPLAYNICLLGESKIGKTTIIKEMLENLTGDEGYMFLEMAGEAGADAISGIVAEDIYEWSEFEEVMEDIEDNRTTDYKDLKTIVIDTYDGWIKLAEDEVVKRWNRKNKDKKTDSINAVEGGFQKGQAKAFELMFESMMRLRKVGVSVIIIGHVKNRENIDIASGGTYQTLTSDVEKIYFNLLKKKMHFIGLAYYDRTIVTEKTGKKNIVTNQDITVNKLSKEDRKIKFRDDNMALDSGSRFAEIVEEIPLNAQALITALTDAIEKEHNQGKSKKSIEETRKEQDKTEQKRIKEIVSTLSDEKELDKLNGQIKNFLIANKKDLAKLNPLLKKGKELGIDNPLDIVDVTIARELAKLI